MLPVDLGAIADFTGVIRPPAHHVPAPHQGAGMVPSNRNADRLTRQTDHIHRDGLSPGISDTHLASIVSAPAFHPALFCHRAVVIPA